MKSAIVTGAAGFVGKAVVKELIKNNVHVFAVDLPSSPKDDLPKEVEIVEADFTQYRLLTNLLRRSEAEVFYHFAWAGTSGQARSDIALQLSNVSASCEAVKIASSLGCKRFVFPASIMQFEADALLEMEQSPGESAIYSVSKKAADSMARITAAKYGIEYVAGLISNIYGPGETSPRLVNSTIRKLLNGEHTSFSPGEQLYDFIYSEDAARAFYFIGNAGKSGAMYYIGNQAPRPLKEFLLEIRDVVSPGTKLGIGEISFSGISLTYREFDMKRLHRELGFEPKVSFQEGIKQTAEWIARQEKNS